jgi:membrane protein
MVLVITFLLLVSLVVNTALAALVDFLGEFFPGLGYVWQFLSFLVSFGMVTLLFAAIYAILPDAQVLWWDAFVGAIITAVLFMLGQFLFGLFLSQTEFGSAYGVAGSFVIIITWIYYAAHILFLGAEFTKVYARRHGSPIVPEEHAVSISSNDQMHLQKVCQGKNSQAGKSKRNRSGEGSSNQQTSHQRRRNSGNLLTNLGRRCTRMVRRWSGWRDRKQ